MDKHGNPSADSDDLDGDQWLRHRTRRKVLGAMALAGGAIAVSPQQAATASAIAAGPSSTSTCAPTCVTDFGAVGDGSTDDTSAIQSAINNLGADGGQVWFPPGVYRVAGTLNVNSTGVHLSGSSRRGTTLKFDNGAANCISITGAAPGVYDIKVADMFLDCRGKTGGTTLALFRANEVLLDNLKILGAWNGIDCDVVNTVSIRDTLVQTAGGTGSFGIRFKAPGDSSARSDVLTIYNTTVQNQYLGGDGLVWDGQANTLRTFGLGILGSRYGVLVKNSAGSNTYYPQFLESYDLEIDGCTASAIRIEGGTQMRFTACDIFNEGGGNTSNTHAVEILADAAGSITNSIQFIGGRIGACRQNAMRIAARNVIIQGVIVAGNSVAGSNQFSALKVVAPAQDIMVKGNTIGEYWGSLVNTKYGIEIDSGVTRLVEEGNSYLSCRSGAVLNNAAGDPSVVVRGGGLQPDGSASGTGVPRRSTPPVSPYPGLTYFDTSVNKVRTYDGTIWQNHW
jgi:hypothetical protein